MKTCYFCKGRVVKDRIRHMHRAEGGFILIDDLPAEVCVQCGEVYLPPDSLEEIDRRVARAEEAKEHLAVPVV